MRIEEPDGDDDRQAEQLPSGQGYEPAGGDRRRDRKSAEPTAQDGCRKQFRSANGKREWAVDGARVIFREHIGRKPVLIERISDITEPDDRVAANSKQYVRKTILLSQECEQRCWIPAPENR